jgi:hypothetical protein
LVLTALVTAGLARDASFDAARSDLDDHGEIIAGELDQLIARLPAAKVASTTAGGRRQIVRIRNLVNTTLEASDGAVVGVDSNGDVQEVLGLLLGVDQGEIVTLPNGVAVDDLNLTSLHDGTTQDGRAGSTVFTAIPLTPIGELTPVLVLADEVNTRPFGAAGGAVLGAAILALVIAAAVAAYLPRGRSRAVTCRPVSTRSTCATTSSAASPTRSTAWPRSSKRHRATNAPSC